MKIENDLGRDDVKRLVFRLGVPSMLAQFVNVLYSVVDRIYVGNIHEVGDIALAGVGICGPIVTLLSAFGSLVGVGGAPIMSIAMGKQDKAEAKRVVSNAFLMLIMISLFVTVVTMALRDRLLWWFGASEVTFPYAHDYITVYLLGTVFALLSTGMNQFIVGQGFARAGMLSVLIGAIANIILDPICIFFFDLGVTGAALATVISQICSCIYVLRFLSGKKIPIRLGFGGYQWQTILRIIQLGATPFFVISFDNVLIISLNTVLSRYGGADGDLLLASAAIMQSFMLLITMPLGGITAGVNPLLGYNFGAGKPDRILTAQKYTALFVTIFSVAMLVIAQCGPVSFVRLFTQTPEAVRLAVWMIRVYTVGVIPLALSYVVVDGFTGMGIAHVAVCLSIFRKSVFLANVFLLPCLFGVKAAFFAEAISDFGGGAMCILVYTLAIRKILLRCQTQCS